jgi:hypothetical protein
VPEGLCRGKGPSKERLCTRCAVSLAVLESRLLALVALCGVRRRGRPGDFFLITDGSFGSAGTRCVDEEDKDDEDEDEDKDDEDEKEDKEEDEEDPMQDRRTALKEADSCVLPRLSNDADV